MSSPPRRGGAGSPTRTRRSSAVPNGVPRGFLAPPKPKRRPVEELSIRELRDLHERNARILASPYVATLHAPAPSTSHYVERIATEQAAVESRLVDLVGVEAIRRTLETTTISIRRKEDHLSVDPPPDSPLSRAIGAKQRALARFAPQTSPTTSSAKPVGEFSFQDAMRLEQEAVAADRKRQEEVLEKKRRRGIPIKGEVLTREQQEARIWAFMNYKPTESDLEGDDDEEEEDEDDPSSWFDDDQDDGRKGQDIVEPDFGDDDLTHVIRVDESRLPGVFYEPREGV